MRQVYPKLAVLLTAICVGILEGGGHINWGAPNFGPLILEWHGTLFVLVLTILFLARQFRMFFVWIAFEDICYWLVSGKPLLEASWISQILDLGGFTIFGVFLPYIYFILIVLWLVCEYLVRVFNFKFELNLT